MRMILPAQTIDCLFVGLLDRIDVSNFASTFPGWHVSVITGVYGFRHVKRDLLPRGLRLLPVDLGCGVQKAFVQNRARGTQARLRPSGCTHVDVYMYMYCGLGTGFGKEEVKGPARPELRLSYLELTQAGTRN
jgi:hypothetical protein